MLLLTGQPVGAQVITETEGEEMSLYKTYKDAPKTKLPAPAPGGMSVEKAIKARRSVRSFTDQPLTLPQVSQILLSAYGITQRRGDEDHRAVPSAGAMFPLDLYLLAHHVDSLAPGLYHFQVSDSTLELVRAGDFSEQIHEASNEQRMVGATPATLIITATYGRITPRYGDRGHQYTHMEVGSICQNVYLQAMSLGLGTCAVGAFDDKAVTRLLELGRRREVPMLVMPIGVPSGN
jgi:SagB-type dehydrogenase family enzyme